MSSRSQSNYEGLRDSIVYDLSTLGIDVTAFELVVKDYHSAYKGCYRTKTNRVYLYYYEDAQHTKPYSYEELMECAIHEAVHVEQWQDPDFVRVKGVMHNAEFHKKYDQYKHRWEVLCHERENRSVQEQSGKLHAFHDKRDKLVSVLHGCVRANRGSVPVLCFTNKRVV